MEKITSKQEAYKNLRHPYSILVGAIKCAEHISCSFVKDFCEIFNEHFATESNPKFTEPLKKSANLRIELLSRIANSDDFNMNHPIFNPDLEIWTNKQNMLTKLGKSTAFYYEDDFVKNKSIHEAFSIPPDADRSFSESESAGSSDSGTHLSDDGTIRSFDGDVTGEQFDPLLIQGNDLFASLENILKPKGNISVNDFSFEQPTSTKLNSSVSVAENIFRMSSKGADLTGIFDNSWSHS